MRSILPSLVTVGSYKNDLHVAELAEHSHGLAAVTGSIEINIDHRGISHFLHAEGKSLPCVCRETADLEVQLIQIRFKTECESTSSSTMSAHGHAGRDLN
jgi:hypothetical protein